MASAAALAKVPGWMWRVAFVALCFAGGAGVVAYVLMWAFVPADSKRLSRV